MSLQTLVNKSLGHKPMGFAALLASMKPATEAIQKKAGEVEAASRDEVGAEMPELLGSILDENGKPLVNHRGVAASVWTGTAPENVGCVWITRMVSYTPRLAKWVTQQFKGHNRNSTKPGIDRYAKDMAAKQWPFVGNTLCFVVSKAGSLVPVGDCNGRHTSLGLVKSGRTQPIDMLLVIGIPEKYADRADVNIVRGPKDVIGRLHRFDRYKGISEIDGVPIGVSLTEADCKSMDNVHSQALRIIACVQSRKASVKDSEPLGPAAIAVLDEKFGDVLQQAVVRTYLFDRSAFMVNEKGKSVAGGLKKYVALSHASAMMTLFSAAEAADGTYTLGGDEVDFVANFFAAMVDEANDDNDNPAVVLRKTLVKWKVSQSKKGSSQNIKWNALKFALMVAYQAALGNSDATVDVATLMNTEDDTKCYFDLPLDPTPPAKEETSEGTEISELEEDEELESVDA